jgi:hypothetical protein
MASPQMNADKRRFEICVHLRLFDPWNPRNPRQRTDPWNPRNPWQRTDESVKSMVGIVVDIRG